MSGEIIVVPIRQVEAHLLAHFCTASAETFGRRSLIGGKRLVADHAFNPRRAQHAAIVLLQELHPGSAQHALGAAALDLYGSELNFAFGRADFGRRR